MKKYLLLLGLLPLLVSCNNSQDPSSTQPTNPSGGNTSQPSGTSGTTSGSQSEEEEALDIAVADVGASNFTMLVSISGEHPTTVTYAFDNKVSALLPAETDPMYYVIDNGFINGYFKTGDKYSLVGSQPTSLEKFTLDYLFGQATKETLKDILGQVKVEDVSESEGTYHIDEVMLHLDASKFAALSHVDIEKIAEYDGCEWPLKNIDFTVEDNHLKTFAAEQNAVTYSPETGISFAPNPDRMSANLSKYGTTVINLPPEIPAPQA